MSHNQNLSELIQSEPLDFQVENEGMKYCLKEGANYFGSNQANSIIFPGEDVAPFAGIFFLRNEAVLMRVASSVEITYNQKSADNQVIYSGDSGMILTYGDLKFRIIKEGGRLAVSFMTVAE